MSLLNRKAVIMKTKQRHHRVWSRVTIVTPAAESSSTPGGAPRPIIPFVSPTKDKPKYGTDHARIASDFEQGDVVRCCCEIHCFQREEGTSLTTMKKF